MTRLLTLVPLIFDSDKVTKYHWYHLFQSFLLMNPTISVGFLPLLFRAQVTKTYLQQTSIFWNSYAILRMFFKLLSKHLYILQKAVCKHQTFSFSESAGIQYELTVRMLDKQQFSLKVFLCVIGL